MPFVNFEPFETETGSNSFKMHPKILKIWQQGSASSFFTVYTAISKLCVHTTMQRPRTHDFSYFWFSLFDFPTLIFRFLDFLFFDFPFSIFLFFKFPILDFPSPAFCRHQVRGLVTGHFSSYEQLEASTSLVCHGTQAVASSSYIVIRLRLTYRKTKYVF